MQFSFLLIKNAMNRHLEKMLADANHLFVADVSKEEMWTTYLNSFPEGTNPIMRTRTEHDCSCCRHFMRDFGNVVSIKDGKVTTIWDFSIAEVGDYGPVVSAMQYLIRSKSIRDIFVTDIAEIGTDKTPEMFENGDVYAWEHFHTVLPSRFVMANKRVSKDTIRGNAHSQKDVFKRSLEELAPDSIATVLELIASKSLYKGEEWEAQLNAFLSLKLAYDKLDEIEQDLFAWEYSQKVGPVLAKIRNHSIGTLLIDISNGDDLDDAVKKYEKIVAPSNYMRPKTIFTAKMLKDAEQTLTELGLLDSLPRRFATIHDITVNNILFANRDAKSKMIGGSVFDQMAKEVTTKPKDFDRVEEVPIDVFVKDILPTITNLEVYLENKHASNMVSLIAPQNPESPTMFKWNNGFSWAYTGGMTDSMVKHVKALGGDVDGVLRFSIMWNHEGIKNTADGGNNNDFDAHCIEPGPFGTHIYFGNRGYRHKSSGMLDVDITRPFSQTPDGVAVENITWSNAKNMPRGTYRMFVHNYSHNGGRTGFTAEIAFDGQIHTFECNRELRQGEEVDVAKVTYSNSDGFSIDGKLPSSVTSRKVWDLDTNQFQPVSVMMYSPNYWDEQNGIGNKHYFFMLKGAKNPERPNGFFNEYLRSDLINHKRVFEALGAKMRVEDDDNQLSGVGFSSTQRNSVVVRVTGHVNRILKVVF